ncbi:MAG: glycine zipper 2TM domain-containing protein [Sphingomonas sp.]|uniref:glycine zipper 2TM domain-containing protein n=1 Tax=Sphingomonas sp. TaxID=28214 RepID=UPI001AC345CE|nr:glycine zipper 2TM domain-containing protein [Sphingomonas sp.]MBN8816627.1 glycine zipper 2TM domain-containing protein [Sphingomonas sp.]
MLKKLSIVGAALAMTATAVIPAAPAMAQSRYDRGYRDGNYNGYGYNNGYDNRRTYRGYDRNYRNYRTPRECKTERGTVIGAIAGGLLGNVIAGGGDRLLGTVIGGAGGALAGREVAKSGQPGYCRR